MHIHVFSRWRPTHVLFWSRILIYLPNSASTASGYQFEFFPSSRIRFSRYIVYNIFLFIYFIQFLKVMINRAAPQQQLSGILLRYNILKYKKKEIDNKLREEKSRRISKNRYGCQSRKNENYNMWQKLFVDNCRLAFHVHPRQIGLKKWHSYRDERTPCCMCFAVW